MAENHEHLPTLGGDNPNVRYLTENTDLSPRQARQLIANMAMTAPSCSGLPAT